MQISYNFLHRARRVKCYHFEEMFFCFRSGIFARKSCLGDFCKQRQFLKALYGLFSKKGVHLFKITSLCSVFGKGAVLSYQTFLLQAYALCYWFFFLKLVENEKSKMTNSPRPGKPLMMPIIQTALDKCLWDGNAWNVLSHYDDTSIFHKDENCNISSPRVRSPFKGYPEKSHVSGVRKEMRG